MNLPVIKCNRSGCREVIGAGERYIRIYNDPSTPGIPNNYCGRCGARIIGANLADRVKIRWEKAISPELPSWLSPSREWLLRMAEKEDGKSVSVGGLMVTLDTNANAITLRSKCHPEANGRQPQHGDVAWTLDVPLEDGSTLNLKLGRKGRDLIFGMLIADAHDSGETEDGEN